MDVYWFAQDETLTASPPAKSGALNLILHKAKERSAANSEADDDAKRATVTSSGSTADLIDNMEETDATPDCEQVPSN